MPDPRDEQELRATLPVRKIPTDPQGDTPEEGIALCLSGGGYRAMLFHLGAIWRLNDFGLLPKIDRISSVSGGSITAGLLGIKWSRLAFNEIGVSKQFLEEVVQPIRELAGKTIDRRAILKGVFGPGNVSQRITRAYRKYLFNNLTLQDLPKDPRFVINATNVQSGVLWRFSRPYAWDYRVGKIPNPKIEVAVAVAASSAFPPFLSPLVMKFIESDFEPRTGLDLQRPPYTTKVFLTDGGVYDNLGLETAWKRYKKILVSDAGGGLKDKPRPKRDWGRHAYRAVNIIDNQVRSLRKRRLIGSFISGHRGGTYWGIRSNLPEKYSTPDALPCPFEKTIALADVPTRLKAISATLQEQLINWGYAICDAAVRKHVDPSFSAPDGFPYPGAGVG